MLFSVTVTPGTTAPVGSTTVPRNAPVVEDCAHKQEEAPANPAIRRIPTISHLSCSLVITVTPPASQLTEAFLAAWYEPHPTRAALCQDRRAIFIETAHHILLNATSQHRASCRRGRREMNASGFWDTSIRIGQMLNREGVLATIGWHGCLTFASRLSTMRNFPGMRY